MTIRNIDTNHQSPATTCANPLWKLQRKVRDALLQERTDNLRICEQAFCTNDVKNSEGCCGRHRVSSIRRAMIPRDEDTCCITKCKTCSDREATTEAFGECHHIRLDAAMLPAPKRSRPTNTGLYLIENQQGVVRIRKGPCVDKVGIRCHIYATLTLNRLEEDCSRMLIDSGRKSITVIKCNVNKSSRKRPEWLRILWLSPSRHGRNRSAVEACEGAYDLRLPSSNRRSPLARKLNGSFVGFRT